MTRASNKPRCFVAEMFCSYFRVSSVLNRDVKQFGKKFMFDNDEETCWNSDQVYVQPFRSSIQRVAYQYIAYCGF